MEIILAILVYGMVARALFTGSIATRGKLRGIDRYENPIVYWYGVLCLAVQATLLLFRVPLGVLLICIGVEAVGFVVVVPIDRRMSGRDADDEYREWCRVAPRWARILVNVTGAVGLVGVLGLFTCATAPSWLPKSVEWPIGHVDGVITVPNGYRVVPIASRIQVYDPSWHFVRAWLIDNGSIYLVPSRLPDQFEIFRPRGRGTRTAGERSIYTLNGDLVWSGDYSISDAEYHSIEKRGTSVDRPTPIWWRPISNPIPAIAIVVTCVIVFNVTYFSQRRKLVRSVTNEG